MPRSRSAPAPARAPAPRPRPAASSASSSSAPQSSYAAPQHSSTPHHSHAPPPAPTPMSAPSPAIPQSSGGGGFLSGLMGSVVTGAAMGTGSAVAHRAVDSFMGPRQVEHVHSSPAPEPAAAPQMMGMPPAEGPCSSQVKGFAECMSKNNGDMGACQFYFDMMQQCKTSARV